MHVDIISSPVQGLLISNFNSGSADIKKDLTSNSKWAPFWGDMVINTNRRWRILGFSDCHGEANENRLLRWQRAIAINNLLPERARKQVDGFEAAPMKDCVDDDQTEEGRAFNRSVVIMLNSEELVFEEGETVIGKLQWDACFDGERVYVNRRNVRGPLPPSVGTNPLRDERCVNTTNVRAEEPKSGAAVSRRN